ncbi:hypothetical protein SLA2020_254830 [Shorea laevis]
MAGLDLGSAPTFMPQLQKPDLHLQSPDSNEDDNGSNHEDDSSSHAHPGNIVARRPRGQPPGPKNKPKPPVIINRGSPNTLRTHMLEISSGCDVFDSIATYAMKLQRGICILSGTGTVTNVSLRQQASVSATVTLQGRFEILSLSGSFLPPPAPPGTASLTIYLSAEQGKVVGGTVVGALIASGPVTVLASSFTNATDERLPLDEQEEPPLQMQQPLAHSPGSGGSGNQCLDPSNSSLTFLNLPLNTPSNSQLPVDSWEGSSCSAPFRS